MEKLVEGCISESRVLSTTNKADLGIEFTPIQDSDRQMIQQAKIACTIDIRQDDNRKGEAQNGPLVCHQHTGMTERTIRSRNESNEDCVLTKHDHDNLEIDEMEKISPGRSTMSVRNMTTSGKGLTEGDVVGRLLIGSSESTFMPTNSCCAISVSVNMKNAEQERQKRKGNK